MTDSTPSRREIAANANIRNKPVVKIISGLFSLLLGAGLGTIVWAGTRAFGLNTPGWTIALFAAAMLGWYLISFRTRRDAGGVAGKIEETVIAGAVKAVDPAKAFAALLEGITPAPAMSKTMLRKAGHMVTALPQDGVTLEMVVTRQQQAALLVGIDLAGQHPQDSEAVARLAAVCAELAKMDWDLGAIAVVNGGLKAPVSVGRVVVCTPAQVGKALARIPKIAK
jgi:hypothetical protein